jgi:hypothetical protein
MRHRLSLSLVAVDGITLMARPSGPNRIGPHRCSTVLVVLAPSTDGHFGPFVYGSFCGIVPCDFVEVLEPSHLCSDVCFFID